MQENYSSNETSFQGQKVKPAPEVVAAYALENDDFEAMRNLIVNKEISLTPDEYGNSFLHTAAVNASPEMIKMLVALGADMHGVNEQGLTPYEVAMTSWNEEGLNGFLEAGLNVDAHGTKKMPLPLEVAALAEWPTVESFLLKTGVDVNYADAMGRTMLHAACEYGNVGAVMTLLQQGANPNQQDEMGRTPLHRLVSCQNLAQNRGLCLDKLIVKGADLNAKDKEGKTPLHVAIASGSLVMVQKLIAEGADLNAQDKQGKTPLDQVNEVLKLTAQDSSAYADLKEMKQLLKEAGARSGVQRGFVDKLREATQSILRGEDTPQQKRNMQKQTDGR